MNIRFLETFVWVARLRSFRLAAERVHATQAAVSQRIAALEKDLGLRLLHRDSRDVQLTREGAFVLAQAEAIVRLYGQTRRRASGGRALEANIRLGVSDVVSLSFLPDVYRLLTREYGVEKIDAVVGLPHANFHALKDGQVDVAIGPATSQSSELVHVDLCDFRMAWVAGPSLRTPTRPVSLARLVARHPVVSYARASLPNRLLEEHLRSLGVDPKMHTVSTLSGVIAQLLSGVGISAVPVALVSEQLDRGTLRLVPVREPFPSVRISASYLHAPEDALQRELVSVIREAANDWCERAGPEFVVKV